MSWRGTPGGDLWEKLMGLRPAMEDGAWTKLAGAGARFEAG